MPGRTEKAMGEGDSLKDIDEERRALEVYPRAWRLATSLNVPLDVDED